MIFSHNRKVNCQNYPKSIFPNASIKVEASFLQIGYSSSILLIKSGIFRSIGSNKTVVLTGAKGSNRITLKQKPLAGEIISTIVSQLSKCLKCEAVRGD